MTWTNPRTYQLSGTTGELSNVARDTLQLSHTTGVYLDDCLRIISRYLRWYYTGGPKHQGTPIWEEGESIHTDLMGLQEKLLVVLEEDVRNHLDIREGDGVEDEYIPPQSNVDNQSNDNSPNAPGGPSIPGGGYMYPRRLGWPPRYHSVASGGREYIMFDTEDDLSDILDKSNVVNEIKPKIKEETNTMTRSEHTRKYNKIAMSSDITIIYDYFLGLSSGDYDGRRSNTSKIQELIGRAPSNDAVIGVSRRYYELIISTTPEWKHGDRIWGGLTGRLDTLLRTIPVPTPPLRRRIRSMAGRMSNWMTTTGRDALLGSATTMMDTSSTIIAGMIEQSGTDGGKCIGATIKAKAELAAGYQDAFIKVNGKSYTNRRDKCRTVKVATIGDRIQYREALDIVHNINQEAINNMASDANNNIPQFEEIEGG